MTNASDPTPWVSAVRASHDRLSAIVAGLDADGLRKQSYAKEWTIADALSHLGSGAEIFSAVIEAALSGAESPTLDAFQPIWDTWNARTPEEQAAQCTAANEALVARVEGLSPAERESFTVVMFGRMTLDLAGVLGMRLSEHAVHAWDVEVALDPTARIAPDAVGLLAVRLPMMIGFMGKQQEPPTTVAVTTTNPAMTFTLDTGGVTLTPRQHRGVGVAGAAGRSLRPAGLRPSRRRRRGHVRRRHHRARAPGGLSWLLAPALVPSSRRRPQCPPSAASPHPACSPPRSPHLRPLARRAVPGRLARPPCPECPPIRSSRSRSPT